jgi:hypothetical protein
MLRRAPLAVALAGGALALLAGPRPTTAPLGQAEAAPRTRSTQKCVRYAQSMTQDKGGVVLKLTNRCKVALSCELSWIERCDEEDGKAGGQRLSLEVGASSQLTVSPTCDGDWEVANVSWACESG